MNNGIFLAFDIDGTIYDAGNIIEESFRRGIKIISEKGMCDLIHIPTKEEITATLGYPLEEIFLMLYPTVDKKTRGDLSLLWTASLVDMIRERKGSLIAGVDKTIRELGEMNYGMLVASNGARDYVEAILETYAIKGLFSEPFIFTGGEIKNKTDIISAYKDLNPGRKIIMIGDRYTDLAAARDNGIPFIGCAFGHAGIEEIEGEKYIVHDFSEIPEMLKRIVGS